MGDKTQAGATATAVDDAGQQQGATDLADVMAALNGEDGGDAAFFTPLQGPDSDFADVEELLGLSSLADADPDSGDAAGAGAGDSPSETVDGADDNAEEEADGDGGDNVPDDDAAADTDGDAVDATADDAAADDEGKADAEATKQVPKETRDQRVLRQSHQFRTAVEPVIAPVKDSLKDVVGVAVALQTGDGKAGLAAIQRWSESGARAIIATALADGAEAYVADKYGVDPTTIESKLKGQVPADLPKLLAQEVDFLSEEAQAELKAVLAHARLAEDRIGTAAKSGEAKVAAMQQLLLAERTDRVQEQVDGDFDKIARALKYEPNSESFREFEERVGARLKADPVKAEILKRFVEASTNGDKADARRLRTEFRRVLADTAKTVHGKPAAAAPKPAAAKPAAKAATPPAPRSGARATAQKPVSKQAIPTSQQLDAHLLKFAQDRAKELGIEWRN